MKINKVEEVTMNEIELFRDGNLKLEVKVSPDQDTVWLSQTQMAELFNVSSDNISLHIKNILKDDELDISTIEESSVVRKEGNRKVRRSIKFYNLDMIISVGYRVKSRRGILFRKWANSVLKDYLIKGYSVNKQRLDSLNKTVEIQYRIIASTMDLDSDEVYKVIKQYTKALDLLDSYDHQSLKKPKGNGILEAVY